MQAAILEVSVHTAQPDLDWGSCQHHIHKSVEHKKCVMTLSCNIYALREQMPKISKTNTIISKYKPTQSNALSCGVHARLLDALSLNSLLPEKHNTAISMTSPGCSMRQCCMTPSANAMHLYLNCIYIRQCREKLQVHDVAGNAPELG